jgi:hypothetical protein
MYNLNTDIKTDINDLERRVQHAVSDKKSGNWWKWVTALIVGIVAVGLLWFLKRKLSGQGEELARLRTEKQQKVVEMAQLAHEAKVAPHQERLKELNAKALGLSDELRLIDAQLDAQEAAHTDALTRIEQITGWVELDLFNKQNR